LRIGESVRRAVLDPYGPIQFQQVEEEVDLIAAVLHAVRALAGAEVRRDDATDIEGRREQRMNDRVLVVRLVLRVGVDDDAVLALARDAAEGVEHGFLPTWTARARTIIAGANTRGRANVRHRPVNACG